LGFFGHLALYLLLKLKELYSYFYVFFTCFKTFLNFSGFNFLTICLEKECAVGLSLINGSWYFLIRDSMTQYIAQSLCRAQGSPLAHVSSDEELAAVQYFIPSQDLGSTNGVWLDGSDGKEEGT